MVGVGVGVALGVGVGVGVDPPKTLPVPFVGSAVTVQSGEPPGWNPYVVAACAVQERESTS